MNIKKQIKTGISQNQIDFLRKHRYHHHMVTFSRFLILCLFLTAWEFASRSNLIDPFFFSSPSLILSCIAAMVKNGSFFSNIGITLFETLISFLLVTLLGLISATLLWYFKTLSEVAEPYLVILNSLPKSALAPLLIVWLGSGMTTIIVAGISVALFGSIISLYTAFRNTDPEKLKLIETLGGTRFTALLKVVLPSSVPAILSNMKVNVGLSRRCDHRGISGCQAGSRISDHLWNSGISAEYGHHFYPDPLCHCHGTVSVHSVSGASL